MDNNNSIQTNSSLPDPEKERFEQEEQRKYEEWKTQQEGGVPTDSSEIIPDSSSGTSTNTEV